MLLLVMAMAMEHQQLNHAVAQLIILVHHARNVQKVMVVHIH
jgi:hypothetical protein